jgi:uncharacterized Zn finger protein
VNARKGKAQAAVAALRKKARELSPITIEGRTIASTFWGRAWCTNLEAYSDYATRLPRGRSYVRNGAVLHLAIREGTIDALVLGSSTYTVTIAITPIAKPRWTAIVAACSGKIDSLVELLRGTLSSAVMEIVTRPSEGLFPTPAEIELSCSCPDWATMCKHVAAVLYGVGARLDREPELLFLLRAVDPSALFTKTALTHAAKTPRARTLPENVLADVFGIEMVAEHVETRVQVKKRRRAR